MSVSVTGLCEFCSNRLRESAKTVLILCLKDSIKIADFAGGIVTSGAYASLDLYRFEPLDSLRSGIAETFRIGVFVGMS